MWCKQSGNKYITYDLIVRAFLAVFFDDCLFNQNIIFGKVDKVEFKTTQKEVLDSALADTLLSAWKKASVGASEEEDVE